MTDTALVNAANNTIAKNRQPITFPTLPIWANTFGSDTNIKLGPCAIPSVPENTYTAGMIITPARNATTVSKISICPTDLFRAASSFT